MMHYMGVDPYTIGERNEGIRREVRTLRLESDLRKGSGGSWMAALARRGMALVRAVGLTEAPISGKEVG